jgi:hypothetical protein
LLDPNKNGLYANTSGPGKAGEFTNEAGMIGYHEVSHLHLFYSLYRISEYFIVFLDQRKY